MTDPLRLLPLYHAALLSSPPIWPRRVPPKGRRNVHGQVTRLSMALALAVGMLMERTSALGEGAGAAQADSQDTDTILESVTLFAV